MPRRKRSSREVALASLHEQIRHCDRCPLHRTRTQAVPGVGSATARIMFVGEAPGRQEDEQGEPFVGRAGQFFNELLASAGLSRRSVYITNVVKSRPFVGPRPGRNRPPSSEEITTCRAWLDAQLQIVDPVLIVTLGRVALEYFVPDAILSCAHGRSLRWNSRTLLPLYHPAMAQYGRRWAEMLRADFRKIRQISRQVGLPSGRTLMRF